MYETDYMQYYNTPDVDIDISSRFTNKVDEYEEKKEDFMHNYQITT